MPDRQIVQRIGRHEVAVTRPDKVLFPDDGITKLDLVTYYRRVAELMLPHIRNRPLMLERYPDGLGKRPLIQKEVSRYFPDWIERVEVPKSGGTVRHALANDEATLAYLANQACITPHIWLSRADKLMAPDQMVFDLDPSGPDFGPVKATARAIHRVLDACGLPAFLKTSGSRGLHIVVPLKRDGDFDGVRNLARSIASLVVRDDPAQRTLETFKAKRGGRLYLDVHRNGYAQNYACAYAVRARPGAPVSVPVTWRELESRSLRPDGWTMRTVFKRLDKVADPWADFFTAATSFRLAARRVETLDAA